MTVEQQRVQTSVVPGIRWGPVFMGAVVGLAAAYLLNSLWVAWAEETAAIARNLHWYGMVSAIVALALGGFLAGWAMPRRAVGSAAFGGITVWALILLGTLLVRVPSTLEIFVLGAEPLAEWGADPLWARFWALTGGLVAAVLGGLLGGLIGGSGGETVAVDADREVARPAGEPAASPRPQAGS